MTGPEVEELLDHLEQQGSTIRRMMQVLVALGFEVEDFYTAMGSLA